jgi:predicted GNAT family acetyltransferase
MEWSIDTDLAAFAEQVLPWAAREPVLNNVLYTVVEARATGAVPVEPNCFWARCLDGGSLHAVAVRTGPHPLLLSPLGAAAAEALVAHLPAITAVNGPTDAVRAVLAATGRPADLAMAMRAYTLHAVVPPAPVPGELRRATDADAELAARWALEFAEDAHTPVDDAVPFARRKVAEGRLWLWEVDGAPTSMACTVAPAAGVVRVGLVYTPREHRRRGYASACVAGLSQRAMDDGARACMLYTDLANPTSNAIYQAIGYRPVANAETWQFRASL